MYSHPYLCYSFLLLIYLLLFYLFIFVKNTRTNVYMYLISLLMYRYVINDRDHTLRVKQVVVITKTLSALLIIIAALSISPFFGKFMAEHDTTVMVITLALVLSFQIILGYGFTRHHVPYNNINNNLIIFDVLLLSCIISSIEVSLVSSQTDVIITFILCYTTVSWFVFLNLKDRIYSCSCASEFDKFSNGLYLKKILLG
jgi:hypothetical protein